MTDQEAKHLLTRLTVDPEVRFGRPCIRGLRITPGDVMGYLASGMTVEQILSDFPELEPDDIRASILFATEAVRREESAIAATASWRSSRRAVGT